MRTAQGLYENGYITYMRTDSPSLSEPAIDAARRQARSCTAPSTSPTRPACTTSKAKGAQEAHEAIRPAGDRFRTPAQVAKRAARRPVPPLRADLEAHRRLADGRRPRARPPSVRLGATVADGRRATSCSPRRGTVITFRGFLAAYEEGRDERQAARREDEAEEDAPAAEDGRGRPAARRRPHRRRPRDVPAAALHRGLPGQGAGGARDRPPVHLRRDDLRDPGPRVRERPRAGAGARGWRSP